VCVRVCVCVCVCVDASVRAFNVFVGMYRNHLFFICHTGIARHSFRADESQQQPCERQHVAQPQSRAQSESRSSHSGLRAAGRRRRIIWPSSQQQ